MKVYVILGDTKVLVDNGCCKSYDTETEVYAILDNESNAQELVDKLNQKAQPNTHFSYIRSCVTSE